MKVIDVYEQYFKADCTYNGVERKGAAVKLTAESDQGRIKYEVSVTFFPHRDAEDFGISYDAYVSRVLFEDKGRRSAKRDAEYLGMVKETVNELAEEIHGTVYWDEPLIEARYG